MNATEDGDEPLGESPDVPARYDAGMTTVLDAIDRGAVIGVLSAADEVLATKQLAERQTQGINAVRDLHQQGYGYKLPRRDGQRPETFCKHCEVKWPCRTIRALDEAGA